MKFSWFNTSMGTHKQYQAYMYDMNNMKQYKVQEREREKEFRDMNQSQTPRYISRFDSLLYIPAFTQKDFHYMSTQDFPHREPLLRI